MIQFLLLLLTSSDFFHFATYLPPKIITYNFLHCLIISFPLIFSSQRFLSLSYHTSDIFNISLLFFRFTNCFLYFHLPPLPLPNALLALLYLLYLLLPKKFLLIHQIWISLIDSCLCHKHKGTHTYTYMYIDTARYAIMYKYIYACMYVNLLAWSVCTIVNYLLVCNNLRA